MLLTRRPAILACCGTLLLTSCLLWDITKFDYHSGAPQPAGDPYLYPSNLTLIDLPRFRYLRNADVCGRRHGAADIVMLVTSHAGNVGQRNLIREGLPVDDLEKMNIHRVFLLGQTTRVSGGPYKTVSNSDVKDESLQHGDIVQGDIEEAYRNLTYKHMMGIQWASTYCSDVKFIMKMDDDIIIDIYQLYDKLLFRYKGRTNILLGLLQLKMAPVRDPTSKWYVTKEEFPGEVYDPFLSGWTYFMSQDLAPRLLHLSRTTPYFWIDDVYVTGILARRAGAQHESLNSYVTVNSEHFHCCLERKDSRLYVCDFMVGPSGGDAHLMRQFMEHSRRCSENRCSRRPPDRAITKTCVVADNPNLPRGKGHAQVIKLSL